MIKQQTYCISFHNRRHLDVFQFIKTSMIISNPPLIFKFFFCCGSATQRRSWPPHSWGFLDHTQRRTTVSRTPLHEWPARRRDNTQHSQQTNIHAPRWDSNPRSPQRELPQTYVLDRRPLGPAICNYTPPIILLLGFVSSQHLKPLSRFYYQLSCQLRWLRFSCYFHRSF